MMMMMMMENFTVVLAPLVPTGLPRAGTVRMPAGCKTCWHRAYPSLGLCYLWGDSPWRQVILAGYGHRYTLRGRGTDTKTTKGRWGGVRGGGGGGGGGGLEEKKV